MHAIVLDPLSVELGLSRFLTFELDFDLRRSDWDNVWDPAKDEKADRDRNLEEEDHPGCLLS